MARNSTSTGNDALSERLDLYAEVTQTILAQMESGALPWTRPWKTTGAAGLPTNALTKNRYSGINVVLLWLSGAIKGYSSSRWMTYRQAVQVGGHVRRGERGTMIVKASTYVPQSERERSEGSEEDPRAVPFLKRYTVFNLDQIEGIELPVQEACAPVLANAALDAFVAATGADMRFGGDEAITFPHVITSSARSRRRSKTPLICSGSSLMSWRIGQVRLTVWTGPLASVLAMLPTRWRNSWPNWQRHRYVL